MITTLDELAAALRDAQQRAFRKAALSLSAYDWGDHFYSAGNPGAGAAPADANGVFPTSATAGAIPFADPAGGKDTQVGYIEGGGDAVGTVVLYDRVWHNKLAAFGAGLQSITWPGGTQRWSDGLGVELWASIYSALANTTAATWTCVVTDENGADVNFTLAYGSNGSAGRMLPFNPPAGSTGAKVVKSFQSTVAQASGGISLVLLRRIATFSVKLAGVADIRAGLEVGLPLIQPSACLAILTQAGSGGAIAPYGRALLTQV